MTRREMLLAPVAAMAGRRPNFVFVLVDDLRFDELRCTGHPFAQTPNADRLAREGANFRNAFATTPLCSPSRASFLTGLYPHAHGITDNTDRSAASHGLVTWPRLLHERGYETAFLGKWHMGNDSSPRPGFDHWVSFKGQGESMDPVLNVNGKTVRERGYVTDILTARAAGFLERRRNKPFCLYLSHKAIHPNIQQRDDGSITSHGTADEFISAARHRTLYSRESVPHRPNYGIAPADKPALMRPIEGLKPLGRETATDDATILNRMRMTKAIDEGLGRLLDVLSGRGVLDETVVIFTSDHGYFYGEHGLNYERRLAYEEAIRIPLLIRYPPAFRAGSRPEGFALSIDIAPTALELAGVPAPKAHGRPLTGELDRDAFLIEYYSDTVFPRIRDMGYHAVRTRRWKYIHYERLEGMDELYDLQADPYELRNRGSGSPQAPELRRRLRELIEETRGAARG
ncbi:MAG: Multifunctional alkaline phosphatase superfamily protein PehA [Bryobacteraceae bacterium]|nr:Multifunctional alkaline phosphatase superfamily protein PehA [Bryobacteraceae bacterium]